MIEHVSRPVFRGGEHSVRLEHDRIAWSSGRHSGAILLSHIADVRLHKSPVGAAHPSVCVIGSRTRRRIRISDLHRTGWGRATRRTESFDAFTEALTNRLAEEYPRARLLEGPGRMEWLASLIMLVALAGVVFAGTALMIAQGRIVWPALAFMGLATVNLPLLWPVVRSGGPKPL